LGAVVEIFFGAKMAQQSAPRTTMLAAYEYVSTVTN